MLTQSCSCKGSLTSAQTVLRLPQGMMVQGRKCSTRAFLTRSTATTGAADSAGAVLPPNLPHSGRGPTRPVRGLSPLAAASCECIAWGGQRTRRRCRSADGQAGIPAGKAPASCLASCFACLQHVSAPPHYGERSTVHQGGCPVIPLPAFRRLRLIREGLFGGQRCCAVTATGVRGA